jgi:hypothetical protein
MTRKKTAEPPAEPKPRARKPKQAYIPGTEPPSFPAIDSAAEEYVAARDDRMARLKEEIKCGDKLLALMKEYSLESYSFDGCDVVLDSKTKVKVSRKKDAEDNGDDDAN